MTSTPPLDYKSAFYLLKAIMWIRHNFSLVNTYPCVLFLVRITESDDLRIKISRAHLVKFSHQNWSESSSLPNPVKSYKPTRMEAVESPSLEVLKKLLDVALWASWHSGLQLDVGFDDLEDLFQLPPFYKCRSLPLQDILRYIINHTHKKPSTPKKPHRTHTDMQDK